MFLVAWIGSCGSVLYCSPQLTRSLDMCTREAKCQLAETVTPSATGGRPFSQAFTCFSRARFIAWCMRHPFLAEWQQGSRHFWSHQVSVDYAPASSTHNKKKVLCSTRALVGCPTNTALEAERILWLSFFFFFFFSRFIV